VLRGREDSGASFVAGHSNARWCCIRRRVPSHVCTCYPVRARSVGMVRYA
jgi:hypothetical protein